MTKKHFEALADALAESRPSDIRPVDADADPEWRQWSRDVLAVARVCARSNIDFDRERFIEACKSR